MNPVKVGAMTLGSILLMAYMSLLVTKNQSGFGTHVAYQTRLKDASGIFPKTPIKVAGINAGRIKSIELVGDTALITFEVLERIKLTQGSVIRIKSVGFLGDRYIDIFQGGSLNDSPLPEGSMIRSQEGGGIEDLAKDAQEVLRDLKAITGSFKEAVSPEGGQDRPIKDIVENIRALTANTKELTGTLNNVITGNEQKLDEIVASIHELTDNLAFESNSQNPESLMRDLKRMGPILSKVDGMVSDMQVIIADVKAGRGTVGKLLRDEETIDKVNETLSGVNRIVNQVNNLKAELDLQTGVNSENGNVTRLNLDLFPSHERLYRLGIVTSDIGPESEKEITEEVGGSSTTTTRREINKNTYVFNVQIGRYINNWGFRAGLIESTGGLGIDYRWKKQGLKFSLELFDYDEDLGPNLRLLSDFQLWNVFYGRIALEDLVSSKGEQSFTIGAGLRFTDEDLRGLIGFFL